MIESAVTNPNLGADLSDPAQYRFWQEDHVRFGDLDVIGHVNSLAMGSYFENARVALLRQVFPDWPNGEHLQAAHGAWISLEAMEHTQQMPVAFLLNKDHFTIHIRC